MNTSHPPYGSTAAVIHHPTTGLPTYVLPITGVTRPPLTGNSRVHWRVRSDAVRNLRTIVATQARVVKAEPWPHLLVVLHYVPATSRARDADNLVATLKPCIDALTAAGKGRGWPCVALVPDDTPEHVTWRPPVIHARDADHPRLWLEVTARAKAPEADQ